MYHQFSPDDLARLLRIASHLSDGRTCAPSEAVDIIERAVMPGAHPDCDDDQTLILFTERMRRIRARRNEMVGTQAFRDPAWDMALDLLVAHGRQQDVCVSSLCVGSGVPQTTALRHIERMEANGLIERHPDPNDQRRIFVRLKPEVAPKLERVVASMHHCVCGRAGNAG